MKKGFTLIELLAVILILGIIALIAIPTVNNIITEARYGAFKSGSDNIMKTIEQDCQTSIMKGENPILSYIFTEGKSNAEINVKGELPTDGYILLDKNCSITDYYLSDNKNVYSNDEDVREDYMLKATPGEGISIFKSLYPAYYDNIVSINFISNLNIPEGAIEIKDPSISGNNKVRSWLIPNESNYDLYVGSFKTIYSNYDSRYLFRDMVRLTNIDFSNFNTTFVTDMTSMFHGLSAIRKLNLSSFNTENVKNMSYMFMSNFFLESIEGLYYWNTSSTKDMSFMFHDCQELVLIDLKNWDTGCVQSMTHMFQNCYKLSSLDIKNWNIGKVTDLSAMFLNCRKLTSLDLSNWDTSSVTNMDSLFGSCDSLTNINISNWDTSNVRYMGGMFHSIRNLVSLDLSNFDTSNVIEIHNMFFGCISLTSLNITNWNLNKVNRIENFLISCNNLSLIIINNSDYNSINKLITSLNNKTADSIGTLDIKGTENQSLVDISTANSKYWNVV